MNKEEKEVLLKETYDYLRKTDFDKIECVSDVCLDYMILYEENKRLKKVIETLKETNKLLLQQKGQLQEDLDMLDKRISKAIEYAKESGYEISNGIIIDILNGEDYE